MARAFIGVGANIEPEKNIRAALALLGQRVRLVALSRFYRTPAEGRPEQPDYINGVVAVETDLPPDRLKLQVLRAIERALGRRRTEDKFAPRPIDLDLLLYGALRLSRHRLNLPAPDVENRAFVAIPLAELAPRLRLPGRRVTMDAIAARFSDHRMEVLVAFTDELRRAWLGGSGAAPSPP